MDIPRGLLTALIDSDRLNEVTREGITPEALGDNECSTVLHYIQKHYTEYKKVPSRDVIKLAFPNFDFTDYDQPLEFFIDTLKETKRTIILEEALLEANQTYRKDSHATEALLREALQELQITQKSFKDLDLQSNTDERWQAYLEKKNNPGATGILSGWDRIDYYTLGWQPEDFIVLVGEKYKGKSWLMLWLAYQAMQQGERVLFVTKEMSRRAMGQRFDSIYASIKFDSLRRGELSDQEEERYEKALLSFGKKKGEGSITLVRHGVSTVADIEQKAVEVDATIVFADSVYLFDADANERSNNEADRRRRISQRCKHTAQTLGVPFIVSTQQGRPKGGKSVPDIDSVEWTNAFSQDADTLMMLAKNDVDKDMNRCWMHLVKCRDGDTTVSCVNMDFEYMRFDESATQAAPTYEIDIEDDDEEVMDLG